MTATNQTRPPTPAAKKGLSPKARQWIGIGGLIACLLIGGAIVYWLLIGSSPKRRTVQVAPEEQTNGLRGRDMRVQRARVVRSIEQRDNGWFLRGAAGVMVVTINKGKPDDLSFGYHEGVLSGDHTMLASARFRALQDPAMAREWKITPDQLEKLKKVDLRASRMQPSSEDRESMRQLWDAYVKAGVGQPKDDAQKVLLDKLDEIARANRESSRKAAIERIEEIKRILTAEQITAMTAR